MATEVKANQRQWGRLWDNALTRLLVMGFCLMAWLVGFGGLAMPAIRALGSPGTVTGDTSRLLGALVYVIGALVLYRQLVGRLERRSAVELSRTPGIRLAFRGFAIGFLMFCAVIGSLWAVGAARIDSFGDTTRLIASFAAAMMASVGEELLFRGVLFRIMEQAMGTLVALLASALIFGLVHLVNPGATLLSSLAISIEAGLLLALAFVATRNLWLPIGIHLAWNFTQGGIFGATAKPTPSVFKTAFPGPDWLTGGAMGTDASAVAVTLCLAAALAFAVFGYNRGRWEGPRLQLRLA